MKTASKPPICNILVRPYADKPRLVKHFGYGRSSPRIELNLEHDFCLKGSWVRTFDLPQEIAFLKMSRVDGGKSASHVFYTMLYTEVIRRRIIRDYAGRESELGEILAPDKQKYQLTSEQLEDYLSAANFLSMPGLLDMFIFFKRRLRAFMRDEPAVASILNLARNLADDISRALGIPKELWEPLPEKQ